MKTNSAFCVDIDLLLMKSPESDSESSDSSNSSTDTGTIMTKEVHFKREVHERETPKDEGHEMMMSKEGEQKDDDSTFHSLALSPSGELDKIMVSLSMDPSFRGESDVIIVVGGTEFPEYSRHLRSWSDYFDAAFRNGTHQAKAGKFDFPDRNPDEWKVVKSMVLPFSPARVSDDNVEMLLPWFNELCSPHGLTECDKVIHSQIMACMSTRYFEIPSDPFAVVKEDKNVEVTQFLEKILILTATAIEYNLERSKMRCIGIIKILLQGTPYRLLRKEEHRTTIAQLILLHEECRQAWMEDLDDYVPGYALSKKQELMEIGVLPGIAMSELVRRHAEKYIRDILKAKDKRN